MSTISIQQWLESVPDSPSLGGSTLEGKGRKRRRRDAMPSPASAASTAADADEAPRSTPDNPSKKRRTDGQEPSPSSAGSPTPTRLRRPRPSGGDDAASSRSRSDTSHSSASRSSSTTSLLRALDLNADGFDVASFYIWERDGRLPTTLVPIADALYDISRDVAIVHSAEKQAIHTRNAYGPRRFPNHAFSDAPGLLHVSIERVEAIVDRAVHCSASLADEAGWNVGVHQRILELVYGDDPRGGDLVGFTYCSTASLVSRWKPRGLRSTKIDYVLHINAPPGIPIVGHADPAGGDDDVNDDQQPSVTAPLLIQRLREASILGTSINHTDCYALVNKPVAVTIETKCDVSIDKATLQLGTWHAAQYRQLRSLGLMDADVPFLPGIIITRHEWRFVATLPGDKILRDGRRKPVFLCDIPIGRTDEARGVYRIVRLLTVLNAWCADHFWPMWRAWLTSAGREHGLLFESRES